MYNSEMTDEFNDVNFSLSLLIERLSVRTALTALFLYTYRSCYLLKFTNSHSANVPTYI
jgi:hypothetical protein